MHSEPLRISPPPPTAGQPAPFVPFIGIPLYDGRIDYRVEASLSRLRDQAAASVVYHNACSLLCWNFNTLFAAALNFRAKGCTHFVMQHGDVVPADDGERSWIFPMLEEMRAHDLQVISAVVAIKDGSGETSTALDMDEGEPTRLHLSVFDRLDTITVEHEPRLLINTGLMVVDLSQPWVEEFCFKTGESIERAADGTFVARCNPEDWYMSRWLRDRGVPFGATARVPVSHIGPALFGNQTQAMLDRRMKAAEFAGA